MMRYYKIDVIVEKDLKNTPHYFVGSTLRGAFGYALKKVVCINPNFQCNDCFAVDNCLFYDFYERKNSVHSYRFSKALGSNNYDFSLFIFESAVDKLPYVLSAVHKMLQEIGLGAQRQNLKIKHILCNEIKVYEEGKFNLKNAKINTIDADNPTSKVKLKLVTPLRIKHKNKIERNSIDLKQILQSTQNRLSELKNEEKIRLTFSSRYKLVKSDLRFVDLSRYSNRQKTKMQFGGLTGEMIFDEVDEQTYQLLKIAELIGVGKQTVFGLGEIKIN